MGVLKVGILKDVDGFLSSNEDLPGLSKTFQDI